MEFPPQEFVFMLDAMAEVQPEITEHVARHELHAKPAQRRHGRHLGERGGDQVRHEHGAEDAVEHGAGAEHAPERGAELIIEYANA